GRPVTDACPPDGELERLLAGVTGANEGQALEAHVAGCAACQRRLGELNRVGVTLPPWPANPERGREDAPRHPGTIEQTTNFLPSPAPLTAPHHAPEREIEAPGHPTPMPSSAGATTPTPERRDTALPNPAHGLERPATAPQRTTNLAPRPAADPPSAP